MADTATIWLDPQQADSDVKSTFQSQPKVTALADGGFLVTWTSEIAGLTKIQGRLYDYLGHAVSDELILDGTPDSGNQIYGYDVAALPDGGFAVAYYDNDNGLTVRAARFDAAGLLVHDVLVGDDPQNVTLAPSIAPLSGGSYQVAWNIVDGHASGGIAISDVDADGVAGAPADLAVEAPTQYLSDSAALSDGSIVTVFSETLGSGHADDIRVIIRTVGGDPVKDFYAAAGPNSESGAIVTALKTGGFAVAWTDPQGDSDNSYGVLIAIYDNSGGLVKAPFHPYADPAAGTQYDRALIPLADGGFVAVWTDHGDKTYRAQRFDHDGNTVGSQITLQGPTDATIAPAVGTLLADGRIALTWYNPEFDPNDPNTEIDSDVFVAILDPRGAVIDGTAGADKIAARLEGGTVRGLGGDDLITGRNGADFIDGGTGSDTMIGGGGNDTYVVDSAGDVVDERGGSGVDTVISSLSFSLAHPAHVLGAVEKLVLIGNARIGVGNDAGNTLVGNAVANVLDGKSGSDRLAGGRGKDAFLFDTALNGRTNVDHIADLHHGVDVIRLDDDIFRTVGRRIEAGEFHLGVNAGDAGDRLIYDRAHGRLYYDADGTGAKAKVLFAILDNHALLGATDFAVVA